jgi:hypothetical protein
MYAEGQSAATLHHCHTGVAGTRKLTQVDATRGRHWAGSAAAIFGGYQIPDDGSDVAVL